MATGRLSMLKAMNVPRLFESKNIYTDKQQNKECLFVIFCDYFVFDFQPQYLLEAHPNANVFKYSVCHTYSSHTRYMLRIQNWCT